MTNHVVSGLLDNKTLMCWAAGAITITVFRICCPCRTRKLVLVQLFCYISIYGNLDDFSTNTKGMTNTLYLGMGHASWPQASFLIFQSLSSVLSEAEITGDRGLRSWQLKVSLSKAQLQSPSANQGCREPFMSRRSRLLQCGRSRWVRLIPVSRRLPYTVFGQITD